MVVLLLLPVIGLQNVSGEVIIIYWTKTRVFVLHKILKPVAYEFPSNKFTII